jgi:hypothetical protein
MTWDKAHQIELAINDVKVNRPRGSGPNARKRLPSILWYKDIAKIVCAIVTRFGYGKAYGALKDLPENNGVSSFTSYGFCGTEGKKYAIFMRD